MSNFGILLFKLFVCFWILLIIIWFFFVLFFLFNINIKIFRKIESVILIVLVKNVIFILLSKIGIFLFKLFVLNLSKE